MDLRNDGCRCDFLGTSRCHRKNHNDCVDCVKICTVLKIATGNLLEFCFHDLVS